VNLEYKRKEFLLKYLFPFGTTINFSYVPNNHTGCLLDVNKVNKKLIAPLFFNTNPSAYAFTAKNLKK